MKKVMLLGMAAVLLAGCDKLPFFKVSTPQRKAGLWEQTVQGDRSPTPMVAELCFDAASDRHTPVVPHGPRCRGVSQKFQVAKSGDSYTVDSVCAMGAAGGPTITSHAVVSGDYQSKYTVVSSFDISGASDPARNGHHATTMTAVYKGDCPADIGPGQVKLPDGEVVDMAQLRGGGMGGGGARPGGGGGAPGGGGGGGQ